MNDYNQTSLKFLLKKTFLDYCSTSTAHPIPKIKNSTNIFIKFAWIITFLSATSYCIYAIFVSIEAYLEHDFYTKIEIIDETPTNFPAISLCNLNSIENEEEYENKEYSKNFADNILDLTNNKWFSKHSGFMNRKKHFYSFEQLNISKMLISCIFNRKRCTANDFDYFVHPLHGNCFRFNNHNKIKQVVMQGPNNGLILELFLGNPNSQQDESNDGTYYQQILN